MLDRYYVKSVNVSTGLNTHRDDAGQQATLHDDTYPWILAFADLAFAVEEPVRRTHRLCYIWVLFLKCIEDVLRGYNIGFSAFKCLSNAQKADKIAAIRVKVLPDPNSSAKSLMKYQIGSSHLAFVL